MALTLNETPGSATANTYATLAEANAFVETLSFAEAWAGKTNDQLSAALVQAARLMGTMTWKGIRSAQAQALAWPRVTADGYLVDRDGYEIDAATIPQCVKDAQVSFALALLDDDRAADAGGLSPDLLKVGSIQLEGMRRSLIPAVVYDLCGFYLASRPGMVMAARS